MQNYERALMGLKELHTSCGFESVKREDLTVLLMVCVEPKGEILQLWDSFKQLAIYSEYIVDKIFTVVSYDVVKGKFTNIDLAHFCEQMTTGK